MLNKNSETVETTTTNSVPAESYAQFIAIFVKLTLINKVINNMCISC